MTTRTRRTSRLARRRAVAIGALLLVAVALGTVLLHRATPVRTFGATVIHVTVNSRFVHARLPMTVVIPAGGTGRRPLLVFLHGRGGDENSELSTSLFAALHGLGRAAPDIAFPDGGDHSYWHNRRGQAWGTYVLSEVIPKALAVTHANPHRLALGGISMGGFGAYDLARLRPGRFCAIGGHSAALWTAAVATAPGAFDDAADFTANDIVALARTRPALYHGTRLWLDGGDDDPFHAADEALATALRIPMHVWPGGHDSDYWNAHWNSYLRFYATALADCSA